MQFLIAALITSTLVAQATPTASPSPAATASPPAKRHLTLAIPPGWRRTESGQYNEWMSPSGGSDLRVTPTGMTDEMRGPGVADAVLAMFQKTASMFNHNAAQLTVQTVQVCNGTQAAYRVDDPLGLNSPAFMMFIPGSDSAGLINYEVRPGQSADPAILDTINKICWP